MPRDEIFVTTKFHPRQQDPVAEAERSLERLGRLGRTPAQVLLRWCIQHGVPVIPKSTHRELLAENANVFDFSLADEDMAELDKLDETGGTARALERKWWHG